MSKLHRLLNEYGESHQNSLNKTIHWICIPLIMFSLLGLLWSIPTPTILSDLHLNWGILVTAFVLIYYITLSPIFAIGMLLFMSFLVGICFILDNGTSQLLVISILIFIVAWIAQFYGHNVEGKKPSFLKDLQFLLIGPAWLLGFIYKKIGIRV